MDSSIDAPGKCTYDEEECPISAARLDGASFPASLARLPSNQRSETPALSNAQMQDSSDIDIGVESTEGNREEEEGQQQKGGHEGLSEIRKELEERTGFASYKAYLESLSCDPLYAGHSYINILDTCFGEAGPDKDYNNAPPLVDIVDVSDEDRSRVGVSLRCEGLSTSEISVALCHPPPNTRAQVVLWSIGDYARRDIEDFLNVLGVGLELDPCFFKALRWEKAHTSPRQKFGSKRSLCIDSIGTSVFVAPSFVLAHRRPVPVVLIAGPMYTPITSFSTPVWISNDSTAGGETIARIKEVVYDLVQAAPLFSHYNCDGEPHLANAYIRALFSLLKSSRRSALSPTDTLQACVVPLLQIEIGICRCGLDVIRRLFYGVDNSSLRCPELRTRYCVRSGILSNTGLPFDALAGDLDYLYGRRTNLRSWVEHFENENGALMDFLSFLYGPHFTEGMFTSQIKKESISIVGEVRRLEAEIRDHLQLQGSRLALEESKRSIELSNRQIYESKRVKVFTVLAFFYVPLNLATSVFGMNIQQLNGSGTSIGGFLGTAVMLLFLTGLSWSILEGVQDVRAWLRRLPNDGGILCENQSIFVRLYMIWWLCRNGWFVWTIRTGAGWCLLINSDGGSKSSGLPRGMSGTRFSQSVILKMSGIPQWSPN